MAVFSLKAFWMKSLMPAAVGYWDVSSEKQREERRQNAPATSTEIQASSPTTIVATWSPAR